MDWRNSESIITPESELTAGLVARISKPGPQLGSLAFGMCRGAQVQVIPPSKPRAPKTAGDANL